MRTPKDYRETLAKWRATAPANDHDILPPAARATSSPRHGALAVELNVLLQWHALRNPEQQGGGQWAIAANDNDPAAPKAPWRTREMRPSEDELLAAVRGVELDERQDPVLQDGQRATRVRLVPVGGGMERGDGRVSHQATEGRQMGSRIAARRVAIQRVRIPQAKKATATLGFIDALPRP